MRVGKVLVGVCIVAVIVSCSDESVHTFVPGEKMVFPMKSDGVIEHLGKSVIATCKQADSETDCLSRIQSRIESCKGPLPAVFEDEAQYSGRAKDYLKCVVPPPEH